MSQADRIAELEARVAELEEENAQLRAGLRGPQMSATRRKAIRAAAAAKARAAKQVGSGKGAVKSKVTKQRLKQEAG